MTRTLSLALFSLILMVAACKKSDSPTAKSDENKPADTTKPADTAKPADPAKPADTAKPADPPKAADTAPAAAGTNSEVETRAVAMMQKMGDLFAADAK